MSAPRRTRRSNRTILAEIPGSAKSSRVPDRQAPGRGTPRAGRPRGSALPADGPRPSVGEVEGTVVVGLVKVLGISLVPVALFSLALHGQALLERSRDLGRRLHLLDPVPVVPDVRPLERLAADLRRLRPLARSPRPGIPMARHRGTVAAYDSVLLDTARALSVPTGLADLPEHGMDREAERLRLEDALGDAGISWTTGPA